LRAPTGRSSKSKLGSRTCVVSSRASLPPRPSPLALGLPPLAGGEGRSAVAGARWAWYVCGWEKPPKRRPIMRRRDFVSLVGGAAAGWAVEAKAQQRRPLPVIGILSSTVASTYTPRITAFLQGLKEAGFVEGLNVTIMPRWADDQYDRSRTWRPNCFEPAWL
jgi:hypothetical protein